MENAFYDLREFIDYLEKNNDLVRVKREVDPDLEINAILDRLARTDGPAVLFENVKGSDIPLFGNAFGSYKRLSRAFGCENFTDHVENMVHELTELFASENKEMLLAARAKGTMAKLRTLKNLPKMIKFFLNTKQSLDPLLPVEIPKSKVPCKEVVLTGNDIDLDQFPLIKCWPKDGGQYITLPLVITRDPETRTLNLGIYRMMKIDKNRLCMHWLPQKHGNQHQQKAKKLNQDIPVVVAVGADPALEVAGAFATTGGIDEFNIAGILKGSPIEFTRAEDSDLWVPASSEIVFEGIIKPDEMTDEGPFGEFHGYYSPVKQTPIFHVKKITMRKKPIWHAATTGMPPTEIHTFSKAVERVASVMLRDLFPGVVDINLTRESGTLYTQIISLDKNRPYEAQELMHMIWSASPQSPYVTNIIVVDGDIDVQNLSQVFWAMSVNFRPEQDLTITPVGMADMEKPCTYPRGTGARLGIDATTKWPEEGLVRGMPDKVKMDEKIMAQVEQKWESLGFKQQ